MRPSLLLASLLLLPGLTGCIVPENMTVLREELGYASVELPDLVVHIRAQTLEPKIDQPVSFTAAAEGVPMANLTFTWQLPDGTTASGPELEHAWPEPGSYQLGLEVEGDGAQASDQVDLTVHDNTPPIPEITVEDRDNLTDGDTLVLSAVGSTDPDGDELEHTWIVDDGEPMAGARVELPVTAGVHQIQLVSTDGWAEVAIFDRIGVALPLAHEAELTPLEATARLPLTVAPNASALEVQLTHDTTLGIDDVRLRLLDSDGQAVATSDTEPEVGASTAAEALEVPGGDLPPGTYTLEAELARGAGSQISLDGLVRYAP